MSNQLRKELRAVGASSAEASQLSALAEKLPQLKNYKHINESLIIKEKRWRFIKPLAGGIVGLALGALVIMISQPVLPTSWLYPIQKFSDSIAIDVRPQYRANVMMKRAQQVNTLVADHASNGKIMATLADYTNQARIYKSFPHANYAAFEYCKNNLQQAAINASPGVRNAIQNNLQSLETT